MVGVGLDVLAVVTVKNTALRYMGACWYEGQFFVKILIMARLYGATSQNIVFGVVTVLTELLKGEQKVVSCITKGAAAVQSEGVCV